MQLAVIFSVMFFVFSINVSVDFPIIFFHVFVYSYLTFSMPFSTAFFRSFCFPSVIFFFSHLIMLLHATCITPHLYSCCFCEEVFLLFPVVSPEASVYTSLSYSLLLSLLTAIASRNKITLERVGFHASVQISKASSFAK